MCYLYFADEQLRFREIKWFAKGNTVEDLTLWSVFSSATNTLFAECFVFYKMLPYAFSYLIHFIDVKTEYSNYEAYRYKAKKR